MVFLYVQKDKETQLKEYFRRHRTFCILCLETQRENDQIENNISGVGIRIVPYSFWLKSRECKWDCSSRTTVRSRGL